MKNLRSRGRARPAWGTGQPGIHQRQLLFGAVFRPTT